MIPWTVRRVGSIWMLAGHWSQATDLTPERPGAVTRTTGRLDALPPPSPGHARDREAARSREPNPREIHRATALRPVDAAVVSARQERDYWVAQTKLSASFTSPVPLYLGNAG